MLYGALIASSPAQKAVWSFGFSLANAGMAHPFENPPQPAGTIMGGYGGILEKNYGARNYSIEGLMQVSVRREVQLRLRGGISLRETEFTSVFGSTSGQPVNRNKTIETTRLWHLAPGLVWEHPAGKLWVHAGAELPFQHLKRLETYQQWVNLYDQDNSVSENWRYFPGGFSIGVGPLAGFSIRPFSRLSLGVEARTAWTYTRLKGHYEEKYRSDTSTNVQIGTEETYRAGRLGNVQVALQLRFML